MVEFLCAFEGGSNEPGSNAPSAEEYAALKEAAERTQLRLVAQDGKAV